jgi:hypothetical protein
MQARSQRLVAVGEQLGSNLHGDQYGLPGQVFNHFLDPGFADSAASHILPYAESAYPEGQVTVIGLGSADAFYERWVCDRLVTAGLPPQELTVFDLQQASLDRLAATPSSTFRINPQLASVTQLPLPNWEDRGGSVKSLVLSRAVEHYLTPEDQGKMIQEAARILGPGELYAAQLSSGDPGTLRLLEAAVAAVAGKEVHYLTVDQYINNVHKAAPHAFEVAQIGSAETQRGRGALQQAMRYLNPTFLSLYERQLGGQHQQFAEEVDELCRQRENLDLAVRLGQLGRDTAIQQYGDLIVGMQVYGFFRAVYLGAVIRTLSALDKPPYTGTTVEYDSGGRVADVKLDIEYPIVLLQRQGAARGLGSLVLGEAT